MVDLRSTRLQPEQVRPELAHGGRQLPVEARPVAAGRPDPERPGRWTHVQYDPARHSTIVFDEFDGSGMPYQTLMRLINTNPFSVQTKNGFAAVTATYVPSFFYMCALAVRVCV
eukprot:COSAG06_NODE_207_length_20219_cov_8.734841_13_plen_114_part_00